MSYPVYYVEEDDTLPVLFTTYDGGTGASVTLTGLAVTDIEIYKDGSVTQRSSDSGYSLIDTDGIDIDSTTGLHGFTLDLSDDTDSGFYAVGSWYHVVVNAVTIDSQTVVFIACVFRIVGAERGMAGTALPAAAADAAGGLVISDAGAQDIDTAISNIAAILVDTGTTLPAEHAALPTAAENRAEMDSNSTQLAAIVADTNELQSDDIPGILGTPDGADLAADIAANLTAINALNDPTAAAIADAVWDEAISGHVTLGSFGQALAGGRITGAVNDASAATTDFDTDGFTEASDDHFNRHLLVFTSGNLKGQGRPIYKYTASGQNMSFDRPFTEAPANDDEFVILDIFDPAVDVWLARASDVEANATVLNSRAAWWAAAKLINRADADTTPGTLTVYEDDDTTALFSQALTTDASADPVTQANTN